MLTRQGDTMSLKSKLLIVLFITILFLSISNLVKQKFVIYPSFVALEENEALKDNERVYQALQKELNHLDLLCGDWAIWDDSYEFLQNENREFLERNVKVNTLMSTQLNLILFMKRDGNVIYRRFYNLEKSYDMELPPEDLARLVEVSRGDTAREPQALKGIIPLQHGHLLISSRPVFTSEGSGPSTGIIIMGRLFSERLRSDMMEQTGVTFALRTHEHRDIEECVIHKEEVHREQFSVSRGFNSLSSETGYELETTYHREISRRGFHSIFLGELLFSITAAVLMLIFYFITQKSVVRPLQIISDTTVNIRTTGDYSKRIPSLPENEIGNLAAAFNLLLEKIERQTVELHEVNSNLNVLARIDGLTGLYNRRTFDEMMKSEWQRLQRAGKPLSLILCDIDYFKKFNDYYGHQKGDEALKAVASILKGTINRSTDGAFRYGGEEFCIILPDTDNVGAAEVAERIRVYVELLAIPHNPSLDTKVVTISLGISSSVPSEEGSLNELISEADEALYEAKRAGRNCAVLFEESLLKKPADIG